MPKSIKFIVFKGRKSVKKECPACLYTKEVKKCQIKRNKENKEKIRRKSI